MAGVEVAGAKGALAGGRGCALPSPYLAHTHTRARTHARRTHTPTRPYCTRRPGADSRRRARAGPGSSQWVLPGISAPGPVAVDVDDDDDVARGFRLDSTMAVCTMCCVHSFTQPTCRRPHQDDQDLTTTITTIIITIIATAHTTTPTTTPTTPTTTTTITANDTHDVFGTTTYMARRQHLASPRAR